MPVRIRLNEWLTLEKYTKTSLNGITDASIPGKL
jgi:hypothetical protein